MIFGLRGISTGNYGDVMMAKAIIGRLAGRHLLCAHDAAVGASHEFSSIGLIPVPPSEPKIVIECCGYTYGAPGGQQRLQALRTLSSHWHAHGTSLVFMPQSFGPFDTESASLAQEVLSTAVRVYAREPQSLEYLLQIGVSPNCLRCAPDYTGEVQAAQTTGIHLPDRLAAVIPNQRMLDRTSSKVSGAYVTFLCDCIDAIRESTRSPLIMVHDRGDIALAHVIHREARVELPIFIHTDAQVIKAVIGQCDLVIASRYHAQIAGFVQGVPVIGTGWTHKYSALFDDYGCGESLLQLPRSRESTREAVRSSLKNRRAYHFDNVTKDRQRRTEAMWADLEGIFARAADN